MLRPVPYKKLREFLGNKRILVIEPSINYRTSIKHFLTNLKIADQAKFVSTVSDARREMLTMTFGLFIVEWGLEDTNGLIFCRELRKLPQYKNTPFLLLSVENLRQDVVLASEVEIDGYLLKPFSYEEFVNQILVLERNFTSPGRANALLDIAEERLSRGDAPGAEKNFADVLEIKPNSARALVGLARIAESRGDLDKALASLSLAIQFNPDFIDAHRAKLDIALAKGEQAVIIETALYLHSLSPDNPRYTLILAKTHLDMRHIDGSEEYFRKTISLSPKLAEAYKGLGNVYMLKEEYERAMKNFKKALDLDKDDVSTINSLGLALVRMGDFAAGIEKYMMALKLDPYDHRVLFNIGHAYEKSGELARSKWYYKQSLINEPQYDKAERGLARIDELERGKAG